MPDILIRGMEMPQNCLECTLCAFDGCGSDYCPFTGIEALSIGRQVNCPLIELPPHGELISRDAVLNKIDAYVCGSQDSEFIKNEIIKAMPVVVPAEKGETQ